MQKESLIQGAGGANFNRREFFRLGAGAVGLALGLEQATEAKTKRCSMGSLKGRRFSDLYSEYTGIRGVVPESTQIDFENLLENLWKQKNKKSDNNSVVVKTGKELNIEYKTGRINPCNISEYVSQADGVLRGVKKVFDWIKVCECYSSPL